MSQQEEGLKTRIILASASPRRKKILGEIGLDFEVREPEGDLKEEKSGDPAGTAVRNSVLKAENILGSIGSEEKVRFLISGFDTIVYLGKRILGKPQDLDEAFSFIQALSGRWHRVVTGICIIDSKSGRKLTRHEVSEVRFRKLNRDEIKKYLAAEYVLDKAGAYNIAGPGVLLVEKVKGCIFNIIGVPVFKYIGILKKFDYKFLHHSKE
jgi:septum formation protein